MGQTAVPRDLDVERCVVLLGLQVRAGQLCSTPVGYSSQCLDVCSASEPFHEGFLDGPIERRADGEADTHSRPSHDSHREQCIAMIMDTLLAG